ncbi:retrovirus-related Pol polyprotein from transposon opus [Trichonephila clavipes]|nr:retrovirus-related Pol polyprotein from transposon opus [Trichonephila clavipes]
MEFYHHLPSWAMNEQMPYFSSFSDEWSRDLKTTKEIPVVFKYRNSVHVEEEEAKELLEVITAERLETEQQQKLEQQEQLSIEKLRLEIELSRNANQSATQNNGQTSRVKFLDEEIVKMVVLKKYEPSPKICLENFRKAKRNSDETFSQFASRLTSMWLYYCKLREANDFESVNQLIVADKMFEMLDSETATHIGKSYDEPERAKWNDSEKRSFNGSWGKHSLLGRKKGTELVDGTVAARVDLLGKVIPRRAIEDKLSKLVKTSISVDGKLVHVLLDSGTEITVIKKDLVPGISVEGAATIYLKGIFGPAVKCPLVYVPLALLPVARLMWCTSKCYVLWQKFW